MSHHDPFVLGGFMYNPRLVYAPNRYLPLALQGLIPFNDHNYQHRFYTAPKDPSITIAAGAVLDTQLRLIPGSVIVGLRFAVLSGPPANQVMYLLRDSDTQKSFVDGESNFLNCQMLVPTGASGAAYCLFAKPYRVSGDTQKPDGGGVITASLANTNTTTALNCQLMLVVLEPAQIVTTPEEGSVMVPRTATQRRGQAL
jgi:hypothetical protein